MSRVENLLQQCTVKLSLPGRMGWGTGFFVAPEWILTCAHVVKKAEGEPVQVRWQTQENWSQAVVEELRPDPYDLALLRVTLPTDDYPPCVYLDGAIQSRDPLHLFGYPDQEFDNGCPVTFNCEGLTGDEPGLIKFKLGQVRPGMSGAPLLNQRTGKVCGIVKFTRDRSFDLGGGAVPTTAILQQFPQLRELQQQFHQRDRRWRDLVGKQADIDFQPYLTAITTKYEKWWQLYTLTDAESKQRQSEDVTPIFDFGLMVQMVEKEEPEQRQEEKEREQRQKEKVERFSVLEGLRKYAQEQVLLVGRPGSGKSTALARLLLEEATTVLNSSPSANPPHSPGLIHCPEARQGLKSLPNSPSRLKTTQPPIISPLQRTLAMSQGFEPLADELLLHGRGELRRIPVLVELRYWQGSITQLILNAFTRNELPLREAQLETLLSRSLILFDGVNELPSEEARSQLSDFRRNHPKVPMIFTTRDLSLGGDLGIEKKLEMQPLTEAQMQAFIRAYLPEQAEEMLRQLGDRLREFGQTPLLLWMLCSLFQQTNEIPENLGLVFRLFTQGYERNLKQDVVIESDRDWWKSVLQQLAWVMMQGETPTELRVGIPREEAVQAIAQFLHGKVAYGEDFARKCLRDLQKYHLIQAGTGNEELEFRHQLIQEYYAAEALLARLPMLSDKVLKREYLNYLKWTEPIALMLALVEDRRAVQVVQLALEVDWRLGARLAGEVKPEFQEQTVGYVEALDVPAWLKIQYLEETRSDSAIPGLLKLVEDSDYRVRCSAANALGYIGSERAIPALLKLVEDSHTYVRRRAADALGYIGSERAISALLKLVEDSDYGVRCNAANALGYIGSKRAITVLLKLVKDSDCSVRSSATDALGKIGSERAITVLLKLVKHSDSSVRYRAAEALSNISSQTAISAFLELAKDSDYYVRWMATISLGKIGSERAISALLKLVKDSDCNVRKSAAYALVKIDSERVIPTLLKLVKHPDSFVRSSATNSLVKIGSERATTVLLKLVEDSDCSVRSSAAESLGNISSQTAITVLLKLVEDSNYSVRWSAAKALGNISSQTAITALLKLVEDSNYSVRRRAADALGKIGSKRAICALLKLVEDSDSDVRRSAAKALGKIGSEKVIFALFKLIKDSDSGVRSSAADALGKIGSERTISALLKLVEYSDYHVRSSAAYALGKIGSETAIPSLLKRLEDSDSSVRRSAAEALGKIGSQAAIPALLKLVEDSEYWVHRSATDALGEIAKKNTEAITQYLPHLLTLIPTDSGKNALSVILAIQENCKFYNYEIWQEALSRG
ncbi:MAG: HEAT repeat domain-containing protein [Coleofasciculus sp. B1-GNL1-01]|uniref:HEAT repeat domain-containing protein n=1 Tax=Coleofasciculus sp. B1-GNL1-01 TaxID=3068484 RepID=UPI0032F5F920